MLKVSASIAGGFFPADTLAVPECSRTSALHTTVSMANPPVLCPTQLPQLPSASPRQSGSNHGQLRQCCNAPPAGSLISTVQWSWQADELLAEVSGSSAINSAGSSGSNAGAERRHKLMSLALLAELRLAEALEKAGRAPPAAQLLADEGGRPLPHKLRTAVCCQVSCWRWARGCTALQLYLRSPQAPPA